MMEVESVLLTLSLGGVTIALLLYYLTRRDQKYPPGPTALPLIGNLLQILSSGSLSNFVTTNRKRFGNVFIFEFGGNKRVVISGYDAVYKLLVKNGDYSSTRSTNSFSADIRDNAQKTPGIFWAPYPHWKVLRSFAISTLREDGMGKASLEPKLTEEIELYIAHFIEPNLDKPIDMAHSLCQATNNIISQMMFGRRFDYEDESFQTMISAVNESFELSLKVSMIGNLPLGKYFIKSAMDRDQYLTHQVLLPTLQSYIDEHKNSIDRDNPRDLTDRYLLHSEEEGKEQGAKDACYSESNAKILALHLYIAGTETTSTALRWVMLYMCLHPEVNERVQREISEQIGDRPVSCKDRVNMPYTDAVLLETLRKSSLAGPGLPHTLEKECTVDGVLIPAGADLMINLGSVLHDETVFEDPYKFKPERYLTGDIALKKQRTVAFGVGRRACLGESLAKMEFFMFFVSLLQKYDVRLPEASTVTEQPMKNSLVSNTPEPYDVIFSRR